tara:strand:+ start:602 stop:1684 length:1083 start_codon:yes stop_codon:yes gene_type:complete
MTKELFKFLHLKKKFYLINIIFSTVLFFCYIFIYKGIFSYEILVNVNNNILNNGLKIISITNHYKKYSKSKIEPHIVQYIYYFDNSKIINSHGYYKRVSQSNNFNSLKSNINMNKDYFIKDLSKNTYLSNFQGKDNFVNYIVSINSILDQNQIFQIKKDIAAFLNNNTKDYIEKKIIDFNISEATHRINNLDSVKKEYIDREKAYQTKAQKDLNELNKILYNINDTYNDLVEYCEMNFLKSDDNNHVCFFANKSNKKKLYTLENDLLYDLNQSNQQVDKVNYLFNEVKKINFKIINSILDYRDNYNENYFIVDNDLLNKHKIIDKPFFIMQFSNLIKFLSFIIILFILHIIFYIYKFKNE